MNQEGNLTKFTASVIDVVEAIPYGETLTYGEVALRAGRVKHAGRRVGQAIDRAGAAGIRLPWWRVIGRRNRIRTPPNWGQREKLLAEGKKDIRPSRIDAKPPSDAVTVWLK